MFEFECFPGNCNRKNNTSTTLEADGDTSAIATADRGKSAAIATADGDKSAAIATADGQTSATADTKPRQLAVGAKKAGKKTMADNKGEEDDVFIS